MSVIFVGDSHFGVRNGSHFYLDKQLNFYYELIKYIKENNVSAVFHLGDFFDDRREINIYIMNKVNEMLKKLETCNIPNYFILGNHDVFYKNDNSVNGIGPVFEKYENLHSVEKLQSVKFDDKTFAMIPWINQSNVDETRRFIRKFDDDTYMLGHFGFSELTQFSKSQDLIEDKYFKRFKKVISGHYHLRLVKDNIFYIGSIIDLKWQEELTKHGFMILENDSTENFMDNKENIHKKFLVENKEDFKDVIEKCENKEVKVILLNALDLTNKEYDYYINQIDKIAYSLNVTISNDIFINEENTVKGKTFEQFLYEFHESKSFGPNIDKKKLYKLMLNLYNSVKD